jgi:hypothetical protein
LNLQRPARPRDLDRPRRPSPPARRTGLAHPSIGERFSDVANGTSRCRTKITVFIAMPGGCTKSVLYTGFRVGRKLKSSSTWTALSPVAALTTTDTPGTGNWQYRVFALNGTYISQASNIAFA